MNKLAFGLFQKFFAKIKKAHSLVSKIFRKQKRRFRSVGNRRESKNAVTCLVDALEQKDT